MASNVSKILLGLMAVVLLGCAGTSVEEPQEYRSEQKDRIREQYGTITGQDGFVLFSSRPREEGTGGGAGAPGIGVNVYLWRATLETIDFMPLVQADPFGGVVITDWYAPPETPDERFKLTVYIRDRVLRADGVKVSVFRQTRGADGWVDASVDPQTATGIEDSILMRARELRIAALGQAQS